MKRNKLSWKKVIGLSKVSEHLKKTHCLHGWTAKGAVKLVVGITNYIGRFVISKAPKSE